MAGNKIIEAKCKNKKKCPQKKTCPVLPLEINRGAKRVDVLFIGEAPNEFDIEEMRPFWGKNNEIFRTILKVLRSKYEFTYALTSLVRFRPMAGGKPRSPSDKERKRCSNILLREIKQYKPKVIVCLETAYKFFTGSEESVFNSRGCIREVTIGKKDYNIICTLRPSYFARGANPNLAGLIYTDIEKAILLTQGVDFRIRNKIKKVYVDTYEKVKKCINKMIDTPSWVCIDTETENLHRVYDNRLLSIQLCNDGIKGYVIPIDHMDSPFTPKEKKKIAKLIVKLLSAIKETPFKGFIFHNGKYDLHQLYREYGMLPMHKPILDTQLGSYLLEENLTKISGDENEDGGDFSQYALGKLAYNHGFTLYKKEDKSQRASLHRRPIKDWLRYAAADVIVPFNLVGSFIKQAEAAGYKDRYLLMMKYFSSSSCRVGTYVEHCGLPINQKVLRELSNSRSSPLLNAITDIKKEMNGMKNIKKACKRIMKATTGYSETLFGNPDFFDPKKKQHQEILFLDILKLKPLKIGKTGPAFDKEFQEEYKNIKEIALYTEYLRVNQLFSLYVKSTKEKMSPTHKDSSPDFYTDSRVRPNFSFNGTVTGRLSAKNPNTQQRVSHGDRAETILEMFETPVRRCFIKLDYKVHEVRGLSIISKDTNMTKMFNTMRKVRAKWRKDTSIMTPAQLKLATDTHTQNTSLFYGIPGEEVTSDQRQGTKQTVFGTIFGMSIPSIAKDIGKTDEEAAEVQNKFYSGAPDAKQWLDDVEKEGEKNFYVESPLGRRRHLWGFLFAHMDNISRQEFAKINKMKRLARNSPIQGMCSDFSILAADLLVKEIFKRGKAKYQIEDALAWMMINLVHDSCENEIPIKDVLEFVPMIETIFTKRIRKFLNEKFGIDLQVHFEVDIDIGINYANMKTWNGSKEHLDELYTWVKKEDKKRRKALL